MFRLKSTDDTPDSDLDLRALHDSVRVLSEVVRHLAERIELLETAAALTRRLPVDTGR
jgi:hypothetical protein